MVLVLFIKGVMMTEKQKLRKEINDKIKQLSEADLKDLIQKLWFHYAIDMKVKD